MQVEGAVCAQRSGLGLAGRAPPPRRHWCRGALPRSLPQPAAGVVAWCIKSRFNGWFSLLQ